MHTLRLKLEMDKNTAYIMEKRFSILAHISNQIRKHVKKLLSRLENDKQYQQALDEYIRLKKLESDDKQVMADMKRLSKFMNETRESIGLTKNGLEKYASVMQRRYKKNISSHQVQAEVAHIVKGVDAVLFGNGKDVHYKKESDFHTIPEKSLSGVAIRFDQNNEKRQIDCYIKWNGLKIPVKYDISKPDMPDEKNYINESLSIGVIKYCEIERLWFKSGWHYYVKLYMTENVPKKITPGKSTMGIDEGPSTIAAVSESSVFLEELSPKCKDYNKQIVSLQRKIDKSTRMTNPDRFNDSVNLRSPSPDVDGVFDSPYTSSNHQTDGQPEVGRGLPSIDEDGTAKKKTKDLPPWKFSKTCQRNKARVRELYRRKAEYTKCQHETLLNSMIKDSSIFINEPMDFKALAKKARETKRRDKASVIKNADGTEKTVYKYKRKKRFGKSITDRSPSFLIARLKQKCEQYGMIYLETDKWKYKASQYNHVLDDYIKTALSERFKNIGAITVQRDLYSAFLQSCMDTVEKPDRKKCIQLFDNFVKMQNDLITEMKVSGKSYPACFGF